MAAEHPAEVTLFPGQPTSNNLARQAGYKTSLMGGIWSRTPHEVVEALQGLHCSLTSPSSQFLTTPPETGIVPASQEPNLQQLDGGVRVAGKEAQVLRFQVMRKGWRPGVPTVGKWVV